MKQNTKHPTEWKYNRTRTFRHRKLDGVTTETEYLEEKKNLR